jgi:UDP-3-O-[3-hydroxymyristoyl] glucosamine N-acyltransferase
VAPLEVAKAQDISVLNNKKYLQTFRESQAKICFISKEYISEAPSHMTLLVSANPYKAYALTAAKFYPPSSINDYISEQATIEKTAILGSSCYIQAGVVIEAGAKIGNNCKVGANSFIGRGVQIGDNTVIGSSVTITHSIIGSDVLIYPGVRIGQDGFGFASDQFGHYKIPQLGRVIIGNKVEIGANSCIDRGSGHDTIIGDNTMIDNLVQIGHNVQIGKGCVIVAQVGISGSTKLGDGVMIGGQAGLAGHLNIGSFAQIAAQSGVMKDIEPKQIQGGSPAMPIMQWHRQTSALKKLVAKGEKNDSKK